MKNYFLKELKLEVICTCPLICIHCSTESTPTALSQIALTKCLSIINEAAELGVKKIAFSGGEPLMYEGINEITKSVSQHGIHSTIYTTGNLINIEGKLFELKSNGLNALAFSLYSNCASEHELITRVAGSFNNTITAIKAATTLGIDAEIHFVALKRNFTKLRDVVYLANILGIKKISVLRFVPQGRGQLIQNEILNKNEFLVLQNTITQLRKSKMNIRTGSPLNFLFLNDEPKCNSGLDRLLIDAELNICPCDAFKQIKANEIVVNPVYSNLRDHTLKDCWNGSNYLAAIRSYLATDFGDTCSHCSDLNRCHSGCLAQKVIYSGELTKTPDPSCINS